MQKNELLFFLLDNGVEEKLAKKCLNALSYDVIKSVFEKHIDEVKADYVASDKEVSKAKHDMESNPAYKEAKETCQDFTKAFNEMARPYKIANELRLVVLK